VNELLRESFIVDINYFRVIYGLIVLTIQILVINHIYINYSHSKENKYKFSRNFLLFGMAMYLIVLVIKSSLALSLGMVGALSIIRFRTAVKEPEQIVHFLMITGISIAIAAEKELLSILLTLSFTLISIIQSKRHIEPIESEKKYIRVIVEDVQDINLNNIISLGNDINLLSISKSQDGKIIAEYESNSSDLNVIESYYTDLLGKKISISMITDV
jgi:hypothetical protein